MNEKMVAGARFDTIIDSGTTIIYAPSAAAMRFWYHVPHSKVFDEQQGLYSFPCASVPKVAFSWGGKSWNISAENLNLGLTESGSRYSVGAIAGSDLGLGRDVWLLGDSLMKNAYFVFSFDDNAVGSAELA